MPLLIGQAIAGKEVEKETSSWSAEDFATMCNDLAWAASGRRIPSLPSFTFRSNVTDGGIDGEWQVDIPRTEGLMPTPIIGPGWNVFQYKKRDRFARDRSKIIDKVRRGVRGAAADIHRRLNRTPDRYVLFTNVELRHEKKEKIKEAILEGCTAPSDIHVEVLGAEELKVLLNDNPHLRAAYFRPECFMTWEEAYRRHTEHKFLGAGIDLIGREEEVQKLRYLLQEPQVRIVVLSGQHDVGKSRLSLEATKDRFAHVVIAVGPRSIKLSDYQYLASSHSTTICIIDDPEPDSINELVSHLIPISNLKAVITLPKPFPPPSYGLDRRVQYIHLDPLEHEPSRKILRATGQRFDIGIEDWILRQAGGLPGVLLAAASIGRELRQGTRGFVASVGEEFEKRITKELGQEAIKAARLLSVLTHVGVSGEYETEFEHICRILGDRWDVASATRALQGLEQAGIVRRKGSFVEVSFLMLANHLASETLVGRRNELLALFACLDRSGRVRLLRRLAGAQDPAIKGLLCEFFSPGGPLGDFKSAVGNADLLHILSGAMPSEVLQILESGLLQSSREERLDVSGNARREIMWALEQLLSRSDTSRRALKLVWLLAEAENESIGNNATGILSECFHLFHQQMPLPLEERIEGLKEFISEKGSKEGRIVAIRSAGEAFTGRNLVIRQGIGPEPLDSMPQFGGEEACSYLGSIVDLLIQAAEDRDPEVAEAAVEKLPSLIAGYCVRCPSPESVQKFQILVEWAVEGRQGLDVSTLSAQMGHVLRVFLDRAKKNGTSGERKKVLRACISTIDHLKNELEEGDYFLRVKRWVGNWTAEDDKPVQGEIRPRYEMEIERLVDEAVNRPELIESPVIDWLISDPARKSYLFFHFLGQKDIDRVFAPVVERLGNSLEGSEAFARYWSGWAQTDQDVAEQRLEELTRSNKIAGLSVVRASLLMKANQSGVKRILEQIESGRIDPSRTDRILMAIWARDLDQRQFVSLMQAVAGREVENAAIAIEMLRFYRHGNWEPEEGSGLEELAWRCLESDPPCDPPDRSDFDRLAATFARRNPKRALALLENLLLKPDRPHDRWKPLDLGPRHEFWDALYEMDRKGLLDLLIRVSIRDFSARYAVTSGLRELLDFERDRDLLVSYAKKDAETACVIASCLNSSKPGFWPIVFELIESYPGNADIRSRIESEIVSPEGAFWGRPSDQPSGSRDKIESFLNDMKTPPAVRPWLRDLRKSLEQTVSHSIVWEYDMDVNDLQRHIRDKDSPERLWAIGRVLKIGAPKDWRELLSIEDIAEALPLIDLPQKRRKVVEKALEVWTSNV